MPRVALPLGPPSARGEPFPAHPLVAARARSRATGNLVGIAVASSATFWTPLLLALAARWVLRRAARSGRLTRWPLLGFFRVFTVLELMSPASWVPAAPSWFTVAPVVFPPCRCRHMGGAPIIVRAKARPAGSGVATMGQGAGPLISAILATFTEVRNGAMASGPPPLACRVRSILVGASMRPVSALVASHAAARLHARSGGASSCFTSPARASSQTGV